MKLCKGDRSSGSSHKIKKKKEKLSKRDARMEARKRKIWEKKISNQLFQQLIGLTCIACSINSSLSHPILPKMVNLKPFN